jgi:hypothetical protein
MVVFPTTVRLELGKVTDHRYGRALAIREKARSNSSKQTFAHLAEFLAKESIVLERVLDAAMKLV